MIARGSDLEGISFNLEDTLRLAGTNLTVGWSKQWREIFQAGDNPAVPGLRLSRNKREACGR
jgi:hypothetical protein